jgi:prepilin peptidase CpaA
MMNDAFTEILLAALAALLVTAAVLDLKFRRIPNWLCAAMACLAPLFWWSTGVDMYPDALIRVGVASLIFLFFFGIFCIGGMGGGDVKLGTALALWFPPAVTLLFIVITSLAGAVVSLAAWFHHHKMKAQAGKTVVPYGVAIAIGGLTILTQRFLNQFA